MPPKRKPPWGRLLSKLSHAKPAIQALHWQLTAQTGSTSFDLLKQLYALPQQPINLLIIHIGVNDVIALTKRTHWQTNIRHIIELATRKFGTAIIFASLPPMQLMPALPYPLNHFLGRQAQILDHDLRCICANYPQTLYLRLDFNKARFKPNILFAKDGFHPSAITYDYWTDVLSRVILSAYL